MTGPKNNSPIFVVGTPRSGTTLAATILGKHSNIFMPGETHFFEDIYNRKDSESNQLSDGERDAATERLFTLYDRYFEPNDQSRVESLYVSKDGLKAAFSNCWTYPEVLTKFMTDQMHIEGRKRWGNNAPRDLFAVADILRFYPEAKFIVCVRDIRAFLFSYQGKWKVTGGQHVERLKKLYHPVVTSFLWKSSMRELSRIREMVPSNNLIVVKYEALVQQPENVVRDICITIEEDFQPKMLQIETHNSSSATRESGIFSKSVDGWQDQLPPEEVSVAQIVGKKELGELGYEYKTVSANKLMVLKYFLETPLALWRALDANREHTGPVLPYLFKRIRGLLGL